MEHDLIFTADMTITGGAKSCSEMDKISLGQIWNLELSHGPFLMRPNGSCTSEWGRSFWFTRLVLSEDPFTELEPPMRLWVSKKALIK